MKIYIYSRDLTIGDREVEECSDILNRSRSDIFQVENAEFVGAKCLTISTALDCSRNDVCHLHWFSSWSPLLLIGVLLKRCLPSFEVLNLAASCLDDENKILLKVIASFSAVRFALP